MSEKAQRFSNRKANKVAGQSTHVPKVKFEMERQEKAKNVYTPKTAKQKLYWHMLDSLTLIVANGVAGTSKSYTACHYAAKELLAKNIDKVVLTRPYASCGATMGFNAGNLTEKIFPFLLPMIGYLKEALGSATVDIMLGDGRIEIVPFEVIRGRSFSNTIVLADELQSCDIASIQALTTRIGDNCKLVITGDSRQNDIRNGVDGMTYIVNILDNYEIRDSGIIEFGIEDICRSGICRDFVIAYEEDGWK
jgi:phosphate starvation-inducible PhoH-like protein